MFKSFFKKFKKPEYTYVNSDSVDRERMNDLDNNPHGPFFPLIPSTEEMFENTKKVCKIFEELKTHEKENLEKWDKRFLELAKHVSTWSLDPSTKVGAVIIDENRRVVSVGYNGLPQGVSDSEERLNNREWKYATTVHGEMNAILFANRSLKGCTLYTQPFMPCSRCASMVIQSGIARVVAPYNDNERWIESFKISEELFKEACVELVLYKE